MELFQGNGQLDEDVEDILYELGNVGVGMVSTTIGSMLGVRADIGVNTGLSTIDANGGGLSDVGHFIMMPDDESVQKIMEAISI